MYYEDLEVSNETVLSEKLFNWVKLQIYQKKT